MLKFKNLGAYKTARNTGRIKTSVELVNGMGVTVDKKADTLALPTATTAKSTIWLVMCEREPVEYVGTTDDFKLVSGDYPRLFDLSTVKGEVIEMNDKAVTTAYASIAADDYLVINTSGKWEKASSTSGYEIALKVLKKTTYMGNGLEVEVVTGVATQA